MYFHFSSQPPDLSDCTKLEIRYYPSTLEYFLPNPKLTSVLSEEEKTYVESLKVLTISHEERIDSLAAQISQGSYDGRCPRRTYSYNRPVQVVCYRGDERLTSFTKIIDLIVAEDGRRFRYPKGLPDLEIIEPAEMRPFRLRFACADHMLWLRTAGSPVHRYLRRDLFHKDAKRYPAPEEWCDVVLLEWREQSAIDPQDAGRRLQAEQWVARQFACPSGSARGLEQPYAEPSLTKSELAVLRSHYAMNPDWEPGSPPDTVLLFETKAGWNQHGGAELFTFDNHDPRGGCVLLNDGTVKFIRTEDELRRLRWK